MKGILILLLAIMPFVGVAQETGQSQTRQDTPSTEVEQILEYFDVPQEQQDGLANLMFNLVEQIVVVVVDSLIKEGRI